MLKIKKLVASLIILLLTFGPVFGPLAVYGEETATNSAEVTTTVDSGANSGENTITEPSPTPDPSASPSPEPSPSPATEITTGDSVAVTEIANQVNTTEVNSQVIFKTLNIFFPSNPLCPTTKAFILGW